VRITHDPYHPDIADKYGLPGETDNEGFDPYADTVGPGIYGGIVKRDEAGQILVGDQYQGHNPRPGPVYAGGGYTRINSLLGDLEKLEEILKKWPDLVNDVSTGGAQPLHMCGMSGKNQGAVNTLVKAGADIEAVDTYGYTPLLRMASNNLAWGARDLLEAGADPRNKGEAGITPLDCAIASAADKVVTLLKSWGSQRKEVEIEKIVVMGTNVEEVNKEYLSTSDQEIPKGFDKVCQKQGWNTEKVWAKLNDGRRWFKADNEAYIYWNSIDDSWWIDHPNGLGICKAKGPFWAPPQTGWTPLGPKFKIPTLVSTFRNLVK